MQKLRSYNFSSGALVIFEKARGWYGVRLYSSNGTLQDKIRTDDYRDALAYLRSFRAIAKNS